jgi:peptide/nickel transport system substrate-binding protein
VDEVVLSYEPDEEKRVAALRSGTVKYASIGADAARRLRSEKDLTILSSPGPHRQVTRLNTGRPPLDDIRVRQAIALTADRSAVLTKVLGGEGRLTGPLPSVFGEWALPPDGLPYRQDLAAAKRLLAEAGHPNGFEVTIKTDARSIPLGISTMLADQLRAVGITLTVQQLDADGMIRAFTTADYDLLAGTTVYFPDPDDYLARYASPTVTGTVGSTSGTRGVSANALTGPEAGRYDEIVEQARAILDPGQRKALYDEAVNILLREAPAIWWCTENTLEAVHNSVKGYVQSYAGRRSGLKKAWLGG